MRLHWWFFAKDIPLTDQGFQIIKMCFVWRAKKDSVTSTNLIEIVSYATVAFPEGWLKNTVRFKIPTFQRCLDTLSLATVSNERNTPISKNQYRTYHMA
jgi:hypothetical protein